MLIVEEQQCYYLSMAAFISMCWSSQAALANLTNRLDTQAAVIHHYQLC